MVSVLEQRSIPHQRASRELASLNLDEVSAVVICATDGARPHLVDLPQVEFFARTGLHVVYPSIVGCDLMPNPYYDAKVACEQVLTGTSHSIIRATQYHQLIWGWYTASSRWPWLVVPAATRYQVLDPVVHATALVEAAVADSIGRGADLGGPIAYSATDLARSCQRAAGRRSDRCAAQQARTAWSRVTSRRQPHTES